MLHIYLYLKNGAKIINYKLEDNLVKDKGVKNLKTRTIYKNHGAFTNSGVVSFKIGAIYIQGKWSAVNYKTGANTMIM